jgi:hypothetical protein
MRIQTLMVTAAVLAFAPTAAMAQVAYNSDPSAGWHYGNGNDYSPADTAVLTSGDDQLYLRWHVTYEAAAASTGDTYNFTSDQFDLATDHSLSFDWGFTSAAQDVGATISITDLGTHQTFHYDVFNPLGLPSGLQIPYNDNYSVDGSVQNSARLSHPFLLGTGFDPNADDTYKVTLTVTGLSGGTQSLTTYAQVGAGAGAVPEPASWAMMLGGFGLVGGAMRRRKAAVRFA